MKKALFIFTVLILSVPAWASVNITCSDEGNGVIGIYYNNTETHNVRAFALNITVDGDAVITGASDFNPAYAVAPGSYVSQTNLGNPVCDATKYPGTLPGLGTNGITIEMASLYAPGQPAPPKSGLLCKLQLTGTGTINLAISANTIRRGPIVMEDPDETVVVTMGNCSFGPSPHCESCLGDIDSDGAISADDVFLMIALLEPYAEQEYWVSLEDHPEWICGDWDQDGAFTAEDLFALVAYIEPYEYCDYWISCDGRSCLWW